MGVKYSKDGRKLLKVPQELKGYYSVKEGTQIICDNAFSDCCSLSSIVIPDSVTSIGNGVYYDCCSLEYIYIPKSVICLKGNPFYGWNGKLECFSLNFMYECDILFNKDKSRIISFRNQKQTSYVISNSVTSIGDHAFYGCSSLAEVIIPNSVTSIGNYVFSKCSSLSSIVIPNSVNSIGEGAFLNCSSLSSIVIPDSVNNIRRGAFYKCNLPYNLKQNFISRFSNELFMFPLKIPGFKSLYNYSKKNYGDN